MSHRHAMSAVVLALLTTTFTTDLARAQGSNSVPYALKSGSEFETGCFGPCDCPVVGFALAGPFVLTPVSDNGLFRTFAVTGVDWKSVRAAGVLRLTGSGTYRVGGEVAIEHQMILDLSLDGAPPVRFDSGLIAGGGEFPQIDIHLALHGFACYDTVLAARAGPATPSAADPASAAARISGVDPNPFRYSTRVDIAVRVTSRVDLGIFDVGGRLVSSLARGALLSAGRCSFVWNGDHTPGSGAAAGVYFVRITVDGRTFAQRIVKVE